MGKRFLVFSLIIILALHPISVLGEEVQLETEAPSVILVECTSGEVLYGKNQQEQRSPASITKIMTLLLVFEALEQGKIQMDEMVTTSAHAKSMGGSQVFLEEGEQQTVETMIKCIVVASGNDASVAMAEHLAGSEDEFVRKMNEKAQELNMVHTNFEDCCGLTDSANHYTTAEDVATMSRELITRYPKVLEYSSIWMENITHNTNKGSEEFGLANTNKMIRSYTGCIGLKTGSTSTAKFCVSAVAERNDIMLLAVIMGAPDSKQRFKDAQTLLNYGFGICQLYTDEEPEKLDPVSVRGGVEDTVPCEYKTSFSYVDTKGRNLNEVEKRVEYDSELQAPVEKGAIVGKAIYSLDGTDLGSVDLIAAQKLEKADYGDYLKKTVDQWFLREK